MDGNVMEPSSSPDLQSLRIRLDPIPIMHSLSLELQHAEVGPARTALPYKAAYPGVFGSTHGGLLMTLADTASCAAVMTLAGAAAPMATPDMNSRFLAPCLTACTPAAKVLKYGRTLVPVEVQLSDRAGTIVTVAQVTYMRLAPKGT